MLSKKEFEVFVRIVIEKEGKKKLKTDAVQKFVDDMFTKAGEEREREREGELERERERGRQTDREREREREIERERESGCDQSY